MTPPRRENHRLSTTFFPWLVVLALCHPALGWAQAHAEQADAGVASGSDAPLADRTYKASSALIVVPGVPDLREVGAGCWSTPKACIATAAELSGLREQVKRLESASITKPDMIVWAILGVGVAAGIAIGVTVGFMVWH